MCAGLSCVYHFLLSLVSRNPNAQNNGGVTTVGNGSPEPPPPPPPPRNHDQQGNGSFNDSKESNEISEAECDRDQLPRNYAGEFFIIKSAIIGSSAITKD